MKSTKLKALVQEKSRPRRPQTHLVKDGAFIHNVYQDGDVMRDIVTGEIRATQTKRGWDMPVKAFVRHPGPFDHIKAQGAPVQVHIDWTQVRFP
jgi:hypothetical protein